MRFLLFSDLHLDSAFAWAGVQQQGARRRRQALRDTLRRIASLAVAERVDALLCAGDLYEHERFSSDTAHFLHATFADLHPLPVFLAPGNHDWHGPSSLYAQVDWSPNVMVFSDDRLQPVPLADGLTLWGAAHRAPANTDGFLERFRVDRGGVHVALFHGSELGWYAEQESGKPRHAPFSAEQIEHSGLHHAFVGHFHRPRDAPLFTYPGNPDPLTFGEDGARGAVIATVQTDGSVRRERRYVASTRAHDLEVDLTGCASAQDVRERLSVALTGLDGVARVTLAGSIGADVDVRLGDLADAAPWLDGLMLRVGHLFPDYDLDAIVRESTVRGAFVRDVREAEIDEDERRRVLIAGLRALDGRGDLEVA